MNPSAELKAALDAAEQARADIARSLYQRNIEVRIKADKSPVTEADVRCEMAIREILEARFPGARLFRRGDRIARRPTAESLWLVDPIDGTKAFVREYPMFSTQIALMRARRDRARRVERPGLWRTRLCRARRRRVLERRPIGVSGIDTLEAAALSSGNLKSLAAGGRWPRYGALVARVNRIRGYGDFLHYHLLAAGKIDAVIETDVNILDIAACVAIVTEAGGRFTDLAGAPVGLNTTSVLATNGPLHEKLLAELGGD